MFWREADLMGEFMHLKEFQSIAKICFCFDVFLGAEV